MARRAECHADSAKRPSTSLPNPTNPCGLKSTVIRPSCCGPKHCALGDDPSREDRLCPRRRPQRGDDVPLPRPSAQLVLLRAGLGHSLSCGGLVSGCEVWHGGRDGDGGGKSQDSPAAEGLLRFDEGRWARHSFIPCSENR